MKRRRNPEIVARPPKVTPAREAKRTNERGESNYPHHITSVPSRQDRPPKTPRQVLNEAWEIIQPPNWVYDHVGATERDVGLEAAQTLELTLAVRFLIHRLPLADCSFPQGGYGGAGRRSDAKRLLAGLALSRDVASIFDARPGPDWSRPLFKLICSCLEAGATEQECFIIAYHSRVNKYSRDHRPDADLRTEIQKAAAHIRQRRTR